MDTLREALVGLGRKKVPPIAQQAKLMTSLVKPQERPFDLERYWMLSVRCALIADRPYREGTVKFASETPFNAYWIGSLLHAIGKLVLGVFF